MLSPMQGWSLRPGLVSSLSSPRLCDCAAQVAWIPPYATVARALGWRAVGPQFPSPGAGGGAGEKRSPAAALTPASPPRSTPDRSWPPVRSAQSDAAARHHVLRAADPHSPGAARHPEAVHQGCHPHAAGGRSAVVSGVSAG